MSVEENIIQKLKKQNNDLKKKLFDLEEEKDEILNFDQQKLENLKKELEELKIVKEKFEITKIRNLINEYKKRLFVFISNTQFTEINNEKQKFEKLENYLNNVNESGDNYENKYTDRITLRSVIEPMFVENHKFSSQYYLTNKNFLNSYCKSDPNFLQFCFNKIDEHDKKKYDLIDRKIIEDEEKKKLQQKKLIEIDIMKKKIEILQKNEEEKINNNKEN
jgi:hypothetical protein